MATPPPALQWLDTDLVRTAWETEPFVAAVEESLAKPATAEMIQQRHEFASRDGWAVRADAFACAVGVI